MEVEEEHGHRHCGGGALDPRRWREGKHISNLVFQSHLSSFPQEGKRPDLKRLHMSEICQLACHSPLGGSSGGLIMGLLNLELPRWD